MKESAKRNPVRSRASSTSSFQNTMPLSTTTVPYHAEMNLKPLSCCVSGAHDTIPVSPY